MTTIDDTVWQGADVAQRYLSGVRGAIPLAQAQLDTMLRLVGWSRPSATTILDLGCGDGVLGSAVGAAYPNAQVVFADFSEPMLAAARKRAISHPNTVFVTVDYGDSQWQQALPQASFDIIVSGFSIHHQPDARKHALYGELFNLLAPGGVFVNIEHVASASRLGEQLFDEAFLDAMVTYQRSLGSRASRDEISAEYLNREDKAANILAPVEVQCRWLREIGFVDVDCYFKYLELAVFAGFKPVA